MEGKRCTRSDENCQNTKTVPALRGYSSRNSSTANNSDNSKIDKGYKPIKEYENEFKVLYTNSDCFSNKMNDLLDMLNSLKSKPNIIAITEINSKFSFSKKQESEYNIDGYNIFSVNIGNSNFRGIIVYVEKGMQASKIELSPDFKESLIIQVRLKKWRKYDTRNIL